jgi:hypothetical protein
VSQQRREQTEASRSKEAADRWPAEKSGASNGQAAEVDVRGKRLSEIAIPGTFLGGAIAVEHSIMWKEKRRRTWGVSGPRKETRKKDDEKSKKVARGAGNQEWCEVGRRDSEKQGRVYSMNESGDCSKRRERSVVDPRKTTNGTGCAPPSRT